MRSTVVPRPPYHLRTLDLLSIQVQGTLPDAPIAGVYSVEPGGLVKLGLTLRIGQGRRPDGG